MAIPPLRLLKGSVQAFRPGMARAAATASILVTEWGTGLGAALEGWARLLDAPSEAALPATEPDVFISYQHRSARRAERLAAELTARGFDVWWARHLLATGMFRDEIERRLKRAKAVIVLWSPEAVRSKWVLAEAARADRADKLINVHTPALASSGLEIPMPFGITHSVPASDFAAIKAALDALGARRGPRPEGTGAPRKPPSPTRARNAPSRRRR